MPAGRLALIDCGFGEYRMQPFGGQVLLISRLPSTDYNVLFEAPLPLGKAYAHRGLVTGAHRLVEIPGDHYSIVEGALAGQVAEAFEGDIAARRATA